MKLSAKNLAQSFKQNILPLYWIAGDEPLLVQEACDEIRQQALKLGFTNKIIFHVDANFKWDHFVFETQNMSLFADKTFIELRLGNKKLPEQGRKILAQYLQNPILDNLILLIGEKVDGQAQKTKWFKAIEAHSAFIAIWPLASKDLSGWVRQRLKDSGLIASSEAVQLLAQLGEGNLLALKQSIEKLALLYLEGNLELDKVKAAISDSARFDVFTLVDAALAAKAQRTLKILRSLRAEGIEPILILWALAREIRLLHALLDDDTPLTDTKLQRNGVWAKRMILVKAAVQRGSVKLYLRLLQQCALIDEMIKGVRKGNVWDSLERVSLTLAGLRL